MKLKQLLIFCLLFFSGCPGAFPGSVQYLPSTQEGRILYASANRNIFPDDVRNNPSKFKSSLIVWPGVLKNARLLQGQKTTGEFIIQHHYWDWIEDHSIQKAVAFLSPRGEGEILCIKKSEIENPQLPQIGSMAIVFGFPIKVDTRTGQITVDCKMITFASPDWYATDIWDYGRKFLLTGDRSDFKVLRVPLR